MKTAICGIFLTLKITLFPNYSLLMWMAIAVVLDLVTGVAKAYSKGEARTSSGYRKTVVKVFQYLGALGAGVILANAGEGSNEQIKVLLNWVNDGLVIFITYIEITSIFENLNELDKNSMISKYFFKPALKILTLQIKNNPIFREAEKQNEPADTTKTT